MFTTIALAVLLAFSPVKAIASDVVLSTPKGYTGIKVVETAKITKVTRMTKIVQGKKITTIVETTETQTMTKTQIIVAPSKDSGLVPA